jgi:hypothetical protein
VAGTVLLVLAGSSPRAARGDTDGGPLADDPTLIALAVALSCADAAAGPAGAWDGVTPAPGAEVELVATVRARTLRFDEVPSADALLRASAAAKAVWRAERVNLPAHPEPGVVYRDVRVRLTVASDANGLAALLREAKKAAGGIRMEEPQAAPVAAPVPVAFEPPTTSTTTSTSTPTSTTTTTTTSEITPPSPPPPPVAEPAPER